MQRQPFNLRDIMNMVQSGQAIDATATDITDGLNQQRVTRVPARQQPSTTTGRGHARGGVDNGTVALAMSGMSFYWSMPMMMAMAKKNRKRRKPAATSASEPTSATEPEVSGEPYA